ncbi:MAG: tRNA (adenosine(37)-N6)-threonylcarbamoyltransferase complex ATPase subunit type 1 TsaE [Verrucomicrobiia bacterium]
MATFISHSPAETQSLGESWGRTAERGLVIALCGDLGAGKTELVKGIARGLGATERVHSPTFTLVNEYDGGRWRLFHLDLYRLNTPGQIITAGLEEFLQPDGVTVIEWAERIYDSRFTTLTPVAGSRFIGVYDLKKVQIEILNETERRIVYDGFGA